MTEELPYFDSLDTPEKQNALIKALTPKGTSRGAPGDILPGVKDFDVGDFKRIVRAAVEGTTIEGGNDGNRWTFDGGARDYPANDLAALASRIPAEQLKNPLSAKDVNDIKGVLLNERNPDTLKEKLLGKMTEVSRSDGVPNPFCLQVAEADKSELGGLCKPVSAQSPPRQDVARGYSPS